MTAIDELIARATGRAFMKAYRNTKHGAFPPGSVGSRIDPTSPTNGDNRVAAVYQGMRSN